VSNHRQGVMVMFGSFGIGSAREIGRHGKDGPRPPD
jgi:hypothetical protein